MPKKEIHVKGINHLLALQADNFTDVKTIDVEELYPDDDEEDSNRLNTITQHGFDRVCHIIEACENLSLFNLTDLRGITSENIQKLGTVLSTSKQLQHLILNNNYLDSCDSSKIPALRTIFNPNLQALSLGRESSDISKKMAVNILSLIENIPEQCPHLKTLRLSHICIDQLEQQELEAFCEILSRLKLNKIDLNSIGLNRLTDKQFELFCETLQRCEHLTQIVFSEKTLSLERKSKLDEIQQIPTIHVAAQNNEAKTELSSRGKTAATRLDEAWEIYCDKNRSKKTRMEERDYMIDLLDLHHFKLLDPEEVSLDAPTNLDSLLKDLMILRRQQTAKGNIDYIPIITSGSYELLDNAMALKAIPVGQKPEDTTLQQALDEQKLLDSNEFKKSNDHKHSIKQLTNLERDKYNVQISKGLFCQSGSSFNTSDYLSHHKKGFASFTMNTNGEISVFEHTSNISSGLHHSSMNAGAPVLAAGEMQIENGKLISLTTYSGHYMPTLYSAYRYLEYLASRGVDISETTVYLAQEPDPALTNLKSTKISVHDHLMRDKNGRVIVAPKSDLDYPTIYYKVPATQIVYNNKAIMNHHIQLIHEFIQNNNAAQKSESNQAILELVKSFRTEMVYATTHLKAASSYLELKIFAEYHKEIIDSYEKKLGLIELPKTNQTVEKKTELSLFFKAIKKDYEQMALKSQNTALSEEKRIGSFKKTH